MVVRNNDRTERLQVRCSVIEKQAIKDVAEQLGVNSSDYVRYCIFAKFNDVKKMIAKTDIEELPCHDRKYEGAL